MKVIHIGLPKTATTTLQRYTFPRLQEFGLAGDYNPPALLPALKRISRGYFAESDVQTAARRVAASGRLLVSLEGLVGMDPQSWEVNCERNLSMFGADATIIITLREPRTYLRSIYQQVIHQGNIIQPAHFFLKDSAYARCRFLPGEGNVSAINVDAFDYEKLISIYRERFSRVVVLAMESLPEMSFLEAVYDIDPSLKKQLQREFAAAPRQNVAYSRLAMSLTFARERLFYCLGAKTMGSEDARLAHYLDYEQEKSQDRKAAGRFYKRFRIFLEWRKFMQKAVSKLPGGGRKMGTAAGPLSGPAPRTQCSLFRCVGEGWRYACADFPA